MPYAINHCDLSSEVGVWRRDGKDRDFEAAVKGRSLQLVRAVVAASPESQGSPSELGAIEVVASAAALNALVSFASRTAEKFGVSVGQMANAAVKRLARRQEFTTPAVDRATMSEQAIDRSGRIVEAFVTGKPSGRPLQSPRTEIFGRALASSVLRQGASDVARDVQSNLSRITDSVAESLEIAPIPNEKGLGSGDFQAAVAERTDSIITGYVKGRPSGRPHELAAVEATAFAVADSALELMAKAPPRGANEPNFQQLAALASDRHISGC